MNLCVHVQEAWSQQVCHLGRQVVPERPPLGIGVTHAEAVDNLEHPAIDLHGYLWRGPGAQLQQRGQLVQLSGRWRCGEKDVREMSLVGKYVEVSATQALLQLEAVRESN